MGFLPRSGTYIYDGLSIRMPKTPQFAKDRSHALKSNSSQLFHCPLAGSESARRHQASMHIHASLFLAVNLLTA